MGMFESSEIETNTNKRYQKCVSFTNQMKITRDDLRAFKFVLIFSLLGLIYYISSTLSEHQKWGMKSILMVTFIELFEKLSDSNSSKQITWLLHVFLYYVWIWDAFCNRPYVCLARFTSNKYLLFNSIEISRDGT